MKLLQKSYQKILLLSLCAAAMLISKRYQAEGNRYLLESSSQNPAKKEESTAEADIALGDSFVEQGEYEQAIICYEKALKKYKAVYPNQRHQNIAHVYAKKGKAYYKQGKYNKAVEAYQKALDSIEEGDGEGWSWLLHMKAYLKSIIPKRSL